MISLVLIGSKPFRPTSARLPRRTPTNSSPRTAGCPMRSTRLAVLAASRMNDQHKRGGYTEALRRFGQGLHKRQHRRRATGVIKRFKVIFMQFSETSACVCVCVRWSWMCCYCNAAVEPKPRYFARKDRALSWHIAQNGARNRLHAAGRRFWRGLQRPVWGQRGHCALARQTPPDGHFDC